MVLFTTIFTVLLWRKQSNIQTYGFDIGIHDQAIWLAAHGHRMFDTVDGANYLGQDVELISFLFVPLYWLGAGVKTLMLVHTAILALGALPLYRIARRRLVNRWLAVLLPVVYLFNPDLSFYAWWGYHPDTMAITPMLFCWWFALQRRWCRFAVAALVALACKEDVSLALVGMAVLIAVMPTFRPDHLETAVTRVQLEKIQRRRFDKPRKISLAIALASIAWLEIAVRVIIPGNNLGDPPFYYNFFSAYGSSQSDIALHIALRPGQDLRLLHMQSRRTYLIQSFAPVGFLFIFALPVCLILLPGLITNITNQGQTLTISSQYSAMVTVGTMLATVEALGVIRRRWPGALRLVANLLIFTTAAGAVAWGVSPIGVKYHEYWPRKPAANIATMREALSLVPANAGVAVSYEMTPQVTHRVHVYEFPNPWKKVDWLNLRITPNALKVKWIVVDNQHDTDPSLLASLTNPTGPFRVVLSRAGVVAAVRK